LLQACLVGHDQPAAEAFVLAGLAVDGHADVHVFLEPLFHGRGQRAFESAEHHIALNVFFTRQGVDQQQNFATHRFLPLKSRTGSSRALSTSSKENGSVRNWPDGSSQSRLSTGVSSPSTRRMPVKVLRDSTGSCRRSSMRSPAKRT